MDSIVTFVDKYFNKSSNISNDIIDKEMLEYFPEHKNEIL
jgi:hypothetical protein